MPKFSQIYEMKKAYSAWIAYAYREKDKVFVRRLATDLKKYGVDVRTAEDVVEIGDTISATIVRSITEVDFFIVILSSNSVSRQWVLSELYYAMSHRSKEGKPVIIPVVIEPEIELPPIIAGIAYADFSSPDKYDESLKKLVRDLRQLSLKEPTERRSEEFAADFLTAQEELLRSENSLHNKFLAVQSLLLRRRLFHYGVFFLAVLTSILEVFLALFYSRSVDASSPFLWVSLLVILTIFMLIFAWYRERQMVNTLANLQPEDIESLLGDIIEDQAKKTKHKQEVPDE